jgi:uncharacterized protein (TIGR02118 family)
MQCVTILYPNKVDAKFDFDYYIDKHLPMTARLLGNSMEIYKGISTPTGSVLPFVCALRIRIESIEKFMSVMTERGAELIADVPNYTNIEPVIQFDEILTLASSQ